MPGAHSPKRAKSIWEIDSRQSCVCELLAADFLLRRQNFLSGVCVSRKEIIIVNSQRFANLWLELRAVPI